jgi:GNAT superfamily N-acetyltransferase
MASTTVFRGDGLEIRSANEGDVAAMTALLAANGFDHPTNALLVRERFHALLEAGDEILVAVFGSVVIGMVTLHRTPFLHRKPDGRIVSLVVAEAHRGRGVGARLVAAAEATLRAQGCGRVEVTSGDRRDRAHAFYVRAGYRAESKRFVKVL